MSYYPTELIQCEAKMVLQGEVKSADCKAVQLAFCVETILQIRGMKRLQAFKYELIVNGGQERSMRKFAGACRFVYNMALTSQHSILGFVLAFSCALGLYKFSLRF